MAYTKPQIVAQNAAAGSYAAGCPVHGDSSNNTAHCKPCEKTR